MNKSMLTTLPLFGVWFGLLFAASVAHSAEPPPPKPVPEGFSAKLQTLFKKHYPSATFTNLGVNGIRVEFAVTTFEIPSADATKKHENPVQPGPKKGGILCHVYLEQGTYGGQLFLMPRGGGQVGSAVIDKKLFKQLLAAPYSPKRDAHRWVSLSYPSDTSESILKEFRALLDDFEKDVD